ncbi:hypothetical protein L2E82_01220 [Cichorium intybus]|uniref:Uncharacterized protein n=1 Tax=Cichorium intybus TaxID=13427 RepID=A0ACB9GYB8_CICIN|nr:hypothetical protein L2E82_01220 [Cichorium intybus]
MLSKKAAASKAAGRSGGQWPRNCHFLAVQGVILTISETFSWLGISPSPWRVDLGEPAGEWRWSGAGERPRGLATPLARLLREA